MKIEIKTLTPVRLMKLFIAGSRWLSKYADVLNDLNVYPVPDGDTGTNMSMTLQAVENELVKLQEEPKMEELTEVIAEAVLLGARGNSGTILSQIVQGFLSVVSEKEEIDVETAKKAFVKAKEKAYMAVSQPVEGTMLTVIRKVAEAAENYQVEGENEADFIPFLVHLKNVANEAVEDTPNLLPKLKEAGVVDAGGKGIFYVLEGFEKSVTDPEMIKDLARIAKSQINRKQKLEYINKEEIKFQYCTEFIIESGDFDLEEYKSKIITYGDSMVCAQTTKKTKTHIHTNNPGLVLEVAGSLGNLNNIKIENMKIQHSHVLTNEKELEKEIAEDIVKVDDRFIFNELPTNNRVVYAIADNREIGELFIKNGATAVLLGGQTKNPSVSDIEEGLKKIEGKTIYLLPNNKNIIGSAKIAAERDDRDVIVIETKSMLAGNHFIKNKKSTVKDILRQSSLNYSIEITKAVRDTKINDVEIKVGNYISLVNGDFFDKAETQAELIKKVYDKYINENTLNIFAVHGKDSDDLANEALKDTKGIKYSEYNGSQDNYSYYIYIEQRDLTRSKIAIVTDSASDLTRELIGDLEISVVPLKVKMGENTFKDGVTISKKEFWNRLLTEKILPKTAQPSPAEFRDTYEDLFNKGYEKIISIHLSSKLSGTQQAAKVAREMLGRKEDIYIVDSKSATFGEAHQVLEAAKMAKEDRTVKEILDNVYEISEKMKVYFAVSDLSFLEKGGRIGKASSVIGELLKIKPILKVEAGEVMLETKAFGERGALSYMEKLLKNESKHSSLIVYSAWGGTNQELQLSDDIRRFSDSLKKTDYKGRFEVGATIGSHTGSVFGLGLIAKIR